MAGLRFLSACSSRGASLTGDTMPSRLFRSLRADGISLPDNSRKPTPARKPDAAGSQAIRPCASAISMAGIRRDHTDAAIITPAAKPSITCSSRVFILAFRKNTMAAPTAVPRKGIITITNSSISVLRSSASILAKAAFALNTIVCGYACIKCRGGYSSLCPAIWPLNAPACFVAYTQAAYGIQHGQHHDAHVCEYGNPHVCNAKGAQYQADCLDCQGKYDVFIDDAQTLP